MKLSFAQAKEFFFDRMKVIDALDKGRAAALARIGGFVRTAARRSMRKARRMRESELSETQLAIFQAGGRKRDALPLKSSEPGESPRMRSGALKRGIVFAYDPRTKSVVSGPVKYQSAGEAAANLEYGGVTNVIRIESPLPGRRPPRASHAQLQAFLRKRAAGTLKPDGRLRKRKVQVKIAARPYMSPALEKARPMFEKQFQNLIKS